MAGAGLALSLGASFSVLKTTAPPAAIAAAAKRNRRNHETPAILAPALTFYMQQRQSRATSRAEGNGPAVPVIDAAAATCPLRLAQNSLIRNRTGARLDRSPAPRPAIASPR